MVTWLFLGWQLSQTVTAALHEDCCLEERIKESSAQDEC